MILKKKDMLDITKIDKKEILTYDQSFILYLYYMSKKVTKEFLKINLLIIKHFRGLIFRDGIYYQNLHQKNFVVLKSL